jgi:hypothetical protein
MANKKVKFELTAVDKTKAAFDKVTKGLKTVGGAAAGVTKGVAGIGIAAGATATALALMVDKSFQAVDAIGKTATQTGIATDTLQAFHLAARESGTTIEGANTALIKFARSIGDAERGLKTQADIFKNIGVELRTTDGRMRSFDAILEDTAKGIMELGSQSERASALANLFGRQGVILTGAITDLSENGIKKFIDRAKELGIVLSEKVIRRTEEFNDAVGVIKMQIGSFVNNITTSFLPVFEKMRESIAKFIQDSIDEAGGMDALGVKIANTVIEFAATAIENFGVFRDQFAQMINDAELKLKELQIAFAKFNINLLQMNPFKDFSNEIAALQEGIFIAGEEIRVIGMRTTNFGEEAEKTANKVRGYKLNVDELRDSNKGLNDGLGELTNSFTNIASPLQVFIDSLGKEGLAKTIEQTTVGAMKKFEDSIVDSLKAGRLEFKNFADYVVEQLLRIAIQQMILKPITGKFESFFEGFGDFFKSSNEGGGYTGSGARAGGIDGRGGFPAILHPNETVIDHTKGQSMGATVNFNISTVDAAGFDQLLASRKGLITSIINNAMNNQGKMGVV